MNPEDFLTEGGFQESDRVAQRSVERAQDHRNSINEDHYKWKEKNRQENPYWPEKCDRNRLKRSLANADEAIKEALTKHVF